MIWQALLIVEEIKKVTKNNPKKIFIEMARENGTKGDRKESRKKNLLYLYNAIKGEKREWKKELEGRDEDIKEYLVGNLCRCTGYMGQFRAVKNF